MAGSDVDRVVVPKHVSFYYLVEKSVTFLPAGPRYDTIYVDADVVGIYDEAFRNREITSIRILPTVEVGQKAFMDCAALTDVIFEGGATTIGEYAFSGCSKLKNVHFSSHNTLTDIAPYAFENCIALTSVKFPETLENLSGFTGCTGLTQLNLPRKLKTIGNDAFKGCTGLTQLTLSGNLKNIGEEAFANCKNIKTLELFNEDTLTIGKSAFKQCKGLEKVFCRALEKWSLITFTTADSNPIFYTHHLRFPPSPSHAEGQLVQRVTIPDGIKVISSYAFNHLDDMTHVELPRSVEKIGNYAFNSYVADIKVVRVGFRDPFIIADSTFNKRNFRDALLIVPNVQGCKKAFSTTMSWSKFNHIIATGHYDFTFENIIDFEDPLVKQLCVANWDTNHDGLLSYGEARSVEDIGRTFYKTDITTFNELQYFSGLNTIPEWAFSNCHQLRSIVLPEGLLEIHDNAFTYSSALEAIHIPALVASIGEAVFAGATSIQQLTLDPDNTHFMLMNDVLYQGIPAETLIYCPPYKKGTVTLPTTVSAIAPNAFYQCEKMTSVKLNQGLERLGDGAFQGCNGLTTLTLPASVTSIGTGCFYCPQLRAIYVADDNSVYKSADGVLYLIDDSELIYYPPARKGAGYSVLDGTEFVTNYSCYESHLEKVTLPATTKELGAYAFGACAQLHVVQCLALDPPTLNANAFKDANTEAMLYVPDQAIDAYRQSPWGVIFPNILPVGIANIGARLSATGNQYYTLGGYRSSVQGKGVHILRRADGTTQKALIPSKR
ncbi:MAG: leucine-rich repeat domain-containing protein [Bacteroidaceae bacterium]|nr:leucine-rich repeat domain-containing protein [Bacteroidaceae bacterium]